MEKKTFIVTLSAILLSAVVTGSMLFIVFANPLGNKLLANPAGSRNLLTTKPYIFAFSNKYISSEFKNKIFSVINEDSNIKALFPNGFNVTSVHLLYNVSINANGKIDGQVTKARLLLSSKYTKALVIVDTLNWKVEKIIEITIKVIK